MDIRPGVDSALRSDGYFCLADLAGLPMGGRALGTLFVLWAIGAECCVVGYFLWRTAAWCSLRRTRDSLARDSFQYDGLLLAAAPGGLVVAAVPFVGYLCWLSEFW